MFICVIYYMKKLPNVYTLILDVYMSYLEDSYPAIGRSLPIALPDGIGLGEFRDVLKIGQGRAGRNFAL